LNLRNRFAETFESNATSNELIKLEKPDIAKAFAATRNLHRIYDILQVVF
jgi:hypothetical protein